MRKFVLALCCLMVSVSLHAGTVNQWLKQGIPVVTSPPIVPVNGLALIGNTDGGFSATTTPAFNLSACTNIPMPAMTFLAADGVIGTQTDYDPGSKATVITFTNASALVIPSIIFSGSLVDGETHYLINYTSSATVTIKDAIYALGTAVERILTPSQIDIELGYQEFIQIVYDSSISRWRVVNTARPRAANTSYDWVGQHTFGTYNTYFKGIRSDSVSLVPYSQSITANKNNFDITQGTQNLPYLNYWTSNASRDVTGIDPNNAINVFQPAAWIFNTGSNNIVLKHQSSSSSAANRLICDTAADITLAAGDHVFMHYDFSATRWRVFSFLANKAVSLTTGVSGTLPVANGGTGLATVGADTYGVIIGGTTATGALQTVAVGTSGQVLTSNGAGAAPTMQNSETMVYRSSDSASVVSSTTFVDDGVLQFAVLANKNYIAHFLLRVTSDGSASIQTQITGPASPTKVKYNCYTEKGSSIGTLTGAITTPIHTAFSSPCAYQWAGTTFGIVYIDLYVSNGANAGTVKLQFTQQSSSATATIVEEGSYVTYRQVN